MGSSSSRPPTLPWTSSRPEPDASISAAEPAPHPVASSTSCCQECVLQHFTECVVINKSANLEKRTHALD
ncbi:unnamed protein product [Urochloa humidicola]